MSEDERAEQQVTVTPRPKDEKPSVHITFSPPVEPPMAMMVSRAERDRIAEMRARSIELAYARGHIRRG